MTTVKDGLDALSGVSGVPRSGVQAIWEQVKANNALLLACTGPHDFQVEGEGVHRKERCALCKGTVDVIHAHWYRKGLEHGRGTAP